MMEWMARQMGIAQDVQNATAAVGNAAAGAEDAVMQAAVTVGAQAIELKHNVTISFQRIAAWIAALVLFIIAVVAGYYFWQHITSLPYKITQVRVARSSDDGDYVPRPEYDGIIRNYFNNTDLGTFLIVVGAKGVGKSAAVRHAALGDFPVVWVKVEPSSSAEDVAAMIVLATNCDISRVRMAASSLRIADVLPYFEEASNYLNGKVATVVYEVESGSDQHIPAITLIAVKKAAKAFVDSHKVNAVVVLSEGNAALKFTDEPGRTKILWMKDMSFDEGKRMVENYKLPLTDDDLNKMNERIGLRAVELRGLKGEVAINTNAVVHARVMKAKADLESYPVKGLIRALAANIDGVKAAALKGQADDVDGRIVRLDDIDVVAPVIRSKNAILYNMVTESYELSSQAYKTAMKEYRDEILFFEHPPSRSVVSESNGEEARAMEMENSLAMKHAGEKQTEGETGKEKKKQMQNEEL